MCSSCVRHVFVMCSSCVRHVFVCLFVNKYIIFEHDNEIDYHNNDITQRTSFHAFIYICFLICSLVYTHFTSFLLTLICSWIELYKVLGRQQLLAVLQYNLLKSGRTSF